MTERPGDLPKEEAGGRAVTRGRFALIVAAALVAGAAVGFAGVYVMAGPTRNAGLADAPVVVSGQTGEMADGQCRKASETARRIAALAKGEVAAFAPTLTPRRVPDLAFEKADGAPVKLSEVGSGVRLVNVWATWCVP